MTDIREHRDASQDTEMTWFEDVAFFHISSVERSIRETLMAELDEDDLPLETYYGDGSAIEAQCSRDSRGVWQWGRLASRGKREIRPPTENVLTSHSC